MAKDIIRPVKGTVDFYPEAMALRSWLYATIAAVSASFGYQEYEAPLLEPLELYAAKSGEELVNQQSFVFADRGGNMVALRPELTPSLARMVAQRQNELPFPLRWWSFGPFWRYERPQRGRTREFFQWNIDLIGVDTPEADAELAAVAARFLEKAGLASSEIALLVNNRGLMEAELRRIGVPAEKQPDVFNLVDRRTKMDPGKWEAYGLEIGLSADQFSDLCGLLEDESLWKRSESLVRFFEAAEAYGVSDYVQFAPSVIRGLAYYTGTVFEARDREGEFRSILGGGRYGNLVSDVGGEPLSAVGFAMGDKVIVEVLRKFGKVPAVEGLRRAPVLVSVFDAGSMQASIAFAASLREAGLDTAVYPEAVRLGNQLRYADRIGVRFVAILGPDEQANGQVTLKDLRAGTQETLALDAASEYINKRLEGEK